MIRQHPRDTTLKGVPAVAVAAALLLASGAAIADGGAEHQTAQDPPILLGSSGSTESTLWIDGVEYCFAGTLGGGVVDVSGTLYILSNNHVLAQANEMSVGEPIIHPGLLDGNCPAVAPLVVAHLSDFVSIKFCKPAGPLFIKCNNNTVDAAIAAVVPGEVDADGEILDIGLIGTTPVSAVLGMDVQKSGRTTGHTVGAVAAVDVDVLVCYADPCEDPYNLALFINQVRVDGNFSSAGDSGSLIVACEDDGAGGCAALPGPVGLLFAGGGDTTFFNRFEDVQSALGVAPAGCDETCFGGDDGTGSGGNGKGPGGGGPPGKNKSVTAGLEWASEVRARHTDELLRQRGVQGTGIAVDERGNPVIEVYVKDATSDVDHPIPLDLEGIPVRTVVTGQIRAY